MTHPLYITFMIILTVYPSNINGFGAILSLPPTTTKTSAAQPKGKAEALAVIHKWKNCKEGYRLEARQSSTAGQFEVKVTYEEAVLEVVEADKFDGELTLSVKVNWYNNSVHIVEYMLADKTCKRRFYFVTKDFKGVDRKTEEDCEFAEGGLSANIYRKNCWIWKDDLFEGWGKGRFGSWGGAVEELPAIDASPDPSFAKAFKLHKWTNVIRDYSMTVYRVKKDDPLEQHYIAIHNKDKIIQNGVKINRFDDDLLNSVSVVQSQLEGQHNIAYKHHDGTCKHRSYVMSEAKPQVTESTCLQFTIYKVLNYMLYTTAVNGWTW